MTEITYQNKVFKKTGQFIVPIPPVGVSNHLLRKKCNVLDARIVIQEEPFVSSSKKISSRRTASGEGCNKFRYYH